MTGQPATMDDRQLESTLRALGRELAYPEKPDLAASIAARLTAARPPRRAWGTSLLPLRPVRRSLVLAIAAVLLIAALVTAAVLGVPGIRIVFGPAPADTPNASSPPGSVIEARPGAALPLGRLVELDEAAAGAGFQPLLPTDTELGPPDAVYLRDRRLTFAWSPGSSLPRTTDPAVGLLLTEFRGEVDHGSYTKMVNSGTRIEVVRVGGHAGYWLSGEEHFLFYTDEDGQHHEESWEVVGDVLIWFDGELTYRMESALGRDATIELAETLARP